jgi:cytochrome c peroxidase
VRPEEDALAIDAYLRSMKPVPSPYLVKGKLSRAARRGKRVFKKAGCARCHPAPLFVDMQMHDVGTAKDLDEGRKFDTPTLVEVWRTAPYLYDGRAATMADVFARFNGSNKHGDTSELTEKELSNLVKFILSQ